MFVKIKKKSVYMAFKRNEAGYTFASLLLTLLVVMIMMPIFILILQLIRFEPDNSQMDAQQFFHYLHTESLVAKNVDIDQEENRILYKLISENEHGFSATATIEQYKNHVRRNLKNGNEIYLRHVDDFQVEPVAYGFHVTLMMENGEVYEKTIEHNTTRE